MPWRAGCTVLLCPPRLAAFASTELAHPLPTRRPPAHPPSHATERRLRLAPVFETSLVLAAMGPSASDSLSACLTDMQVVGARRLAARRLRLALLPLNPNEAPTATASPLLASFLVRHIRLGWYQLLSSVDDECRDRERLVMLGA
ncbi:hypothetical protein JDV02_008146 [Purpureocillium takamizusanense]|uniref:Uncharacterized protein n=1 Tax=Purpureocillium takamizusanense TaxID=2060973 RepID=A0A9Q8QN26_9HYPO|nr:uncharacterized protein JDV02_008146 [Purpureocillium takamizusanense]UNI22242.1 hypothetical protein JDV02_008146 [Purpureocillium takamizusanense]